MSTLFTTFLQNRNLSDFIYYNLFLKIEPDVNNPIYINILPNTGKKDISKYELIPFSCTLCSL